DEEHFYRTQLGYDDAAIATLEAARTVEYNALNTQYGGYGDSFNPGFTYTLTTAENDAIEASIHVFTEQELLHTISFGLLRDIADTQVASLHVTPEVNDPTVAGVDIQTIIIDKRQDVDIEVAGTVDVTAHDSIYLGSENHDINVGLIQTDGSAGHDDVRIKSGQALTNAGPSASSVNVIGGDTILEAANGAIGSALRPFNTDLTATGTLTARADGSITIDERAG